MCSQLQHHVRACQTLLQNQQPQHWIISKKKLVYSIIVIMLKVFPQFISLAQAGSLDQFMPCF